MLWLFDFVLKYHQTVQLSNSKSALAIRYNVCMWTLDALKYKVCRSLSSHFRLFNTVRFSLCSCSKGVFCVLALVFVSRRVTNRSKCVQCYVLHMLMQYTHPISRTIQIQRVKKYLFAVRMFSVISRWMIKTRFEFQWHSAVRTLKTELFRLWVRLLLMFD